MPGGREGDASPPPDLVGVALGSIAAGSATAAGLLALALTVLRDRLGAILPGLVFGTILVAAGLAWALAGAIADTWRRAVTAALAVFGALMLGALTAPADMVAGRGGIGGYTVVLLGIAALAVRYTRRRSA
ncbi:MAG: hypothetical protein OER21_05775 [Gemmatimonadota bacterium]|nr:hypothetical protein [Gemmatimonadota bacterium]